MFEQLILGPQNKQRMIAIVGAGGKTTTMMRLARLFKEQGCSVLVTTTTRIFLPESSFYDQLHLDPALCCSESTLAKGSITVVGTGVESNGKLVSVQPQWLDSCYEEKLYDVILIEADGAKHKSIKAPAVHEPVIPQKTTHVIGVIGLDSVGMEIKEENVHRCTFFKAIVDAGEHDKITPDMIIQLILHPQGLFKNAPDNAMKIVVLTKAINPGCAAYGAFIKEAIEKMTMVKVFVRG